MFPSCEVCLQSNGSSQSAVSVLFLYKTLSVLRDDITTNAVSPGSTFSGNNAAASYGYEISSRRENPLSSYHGFYPQCGVTDPRALQEADSAHLVGENHNFSVIQKRTFSSVG
jgi:hypothetical protein